MASTLTPGGTPRFELQHEDEYDEAVGVLEQVNRLDRVMTMLTYYIACDPFMFPLVPASDIPGMRVAPSRALGPVPSIRIFFTVESDSLVRLWYVVNDDGESEQD